MTTEERASALLEKVRTTTYDVTGHDEKWRNEVASDLNHLMGRVQYTLETGGCEVDAEFAEAALRIVERVATFEDIARK